ncbi:glutamyl-tRNA amidotransferase [Candidatus Gottesmanbacteria bacterium CG11_big_fil_rev_8_21_14_0_20_37_11]|uniref:Glutamyl-tRNA amidotransferase n=3 Tax=Candidatus Gottesmaniibacteriota TaxID=1752720 RepID=A0A2M7RRA3_9BACT|nr:MAG: hypothetical protein AUJ73_00075 [Candidatus Gottesmanbacteria bacterium CG1_02_37_22]PIP32359.1 MAG: glutamyl-tRNA amidotransferase [Candidatus Gottesmanbacteria bacterium CG23_combo_of_CG06-09_8_20_14_all_37_19]PIR07829.1 MAG: glutamyl-tRNA amidotransferase [Candidatus Gottesmanbacteria bacterium CG11_big_fil_rev_8_21_14_0_20_37_11]PIZ02847.1 MAG: glutamyl-tRNA amidotransferase [Candidatus Gottesmanbacteria bacterium CG_4_10_14_0_8_um_filter_37_24]
MIKDAIQKAVNENLKKGNVVAVKVLRFVMSEIKYAEIAKKKEITDEEVISLLRKETKKRKEAVDLFKKAGRNDLVDDESKQLEIIGNYLPEEMSDGELESIIDEVLLVSSNRSNIGRLIGMVMSKLKGRIEGSKVADIVKKKISTSPSV